MNTLVIVFIDNPQLEMSGKIFVELLGENLEAKDGLTLKTEDALNGKALVGIYFSAHWCPPCRGFTPVLKDTYDELKEQNKGFEIVFVSSDRDQTSFDVSLMVI
jgi:nucleoredoxin